jgi:hypothetical protein
MVEREARIQTGFRASESMNEEIEGLSEDFDISKNSLMTMAMRIGLNSLRDLKQVPFQQE